MHDLRIHNSNFHCILQLLCQPGNNNNQLTNQPTKTKKIAKKKESKKRNNRKPGNYSDSLRGQDK